MMVKFKCSGKVLSALLALGVAVIAAGCNGGSTATAPDVSRVKIALHTSRFDKDLYAIDTNHIGDGLQKLQAKYPDFLNYFLDTAMAYGIHGNFNDTVGGIREGLKPFLTHKDFKGLEDTIQKYYPDTKTVDEDLVKGFTYLKYYFPSAPIPRIIYLNMGLSRWPSFPLDSTTLCIGLDMFLGPQYPFYNSIGMPEYMGSHTRRAYIPVSVFSTLYKVGYPFQADDKPLLDLMIQKGKEQYFLHKIMPDAHDTLLFGFTKTQIDWCNANEALVYNFFIQQGLLYNKESHSIMPYVSEGPFARGLEPPSAGPKSTPGNIGSWLGYKIVSAYMAQHPKMTLPELLMQRTDPAKIIDEARYRPK